MGGIAGEARTNSLVTSFYGPLLMDAQVLADQQGFIHINPVRTQNVI